MAVETYHGSCHCGAVRFEADLDLDAGTGKCNCSICSKARNWSASVKPEAFRLLSDPAASSDYQFGSHAMHWPFCRTCGVRSYGHGDIPELGGAFYTIMLASLDDVPAQRLAALPVRYYNGRDNDWFNVPAETGHL
jgi:hypothetical protein